VGERIGLAGDMRAVVTNVVGMCSMDVVLAVRDVKKKKRRRRRETLEAVGRNCTSTGMKGKRTVHCALEGACRLRCPSRSISLDNPAIAGSRLDGISIMRFGENLLRKRIACLKMQNEVS
jgi:NAD-dependent dihydropyrimidine dehydrogenase PreA subunit